jgi:hypothetical protein
MFAELVAAGLLAEDEAAAALADAVARQAPGRDPVGMRTRVVHALRDATAEWRRARLFAVVRIERVLAPLLRGWSDRGEIEDAAVAAGQGVFRPGELARVIERLVRGRIG